MYASAARLGLAISDQLRVEVNAAQVIGERNPLIDAVISFRVRRCKRDRQESQNILG